ncbi:hypothetical protein GW17_00034237 [Ensete ventricosum]|nr:hypothetical protein GW17_00034237 [Ensete ventricosum]
MVRVVYPPPGWLTHRNLLVAARILCLRYSCGKSSGLLPVISLHVPGELPDPFDESPIELPARSHRIVQTRPDA